MKLRASFVSNSSSSSYLVLGWQQEPDMDKLIEYFEEDIRKNLDDGESFEDKDLINDIMCDLVEDLKLSGKYLHNIDGIFGVRLAYASDYAPRAIELPLDTLVEEVKEFGQKMSMTGNPQLYMGASYG